MACTSELIPPYLHYWSGCRIYEDQDFQNEHKLYRLGNPIEGNPIQFPSTVTAYLCKWSFLIKEEDVLEAQDPKVYEDYRFCIVGDIRAFHLKREKDTDGSYLGWHKLTCFFSHSPTECDYSHSEINIRHQIFEEQTEQNVLHDFHLKYDDWKKAVLNGKSLWFKQFRHDYKTEIIKLFCYPLDE